MTKFVWSSVLRFRDSLKEVRRKFAAVGLPVKAKVDRISRRHCHFRQTAFPLANVGSSRLCLLLAVVVVVTHVRSAVSLVLPLWLATHCLGPGASVHAERKSQRRRMKRPWQRSIVAIVLASQEAIFVRENTRVRTAKQLETKKKTYLQEGKQDGELRWPLSLSHSVSEWVSIEQSNGRYETVSMSRSRSDPIRDHVKASSFCRWIFFQSFSERADLVGRI